MGRSTVPESGEILTHQHHIFRKIGTARTQGKTGMVVYLGGVHTLHVDTGFILLHVTNITSRRERKLGLLKSESKGAANEAPICAVPMHAPQKCSLWRPRGGGGGQRV